MSEESSQEKLINYLYSDLSKDKQFQLEQSFLQDPELAEELHEIKLLRKLYQKHLPDVDVPRQLSNKVLRDLEIRPSWRKIFQIDTMLRPIIVGAFAVVLTLGISFYYQKQNPTTSHLTTARKSVNPLSDESVGSVSNIAKFDGQLKFSDLFLGHQGVSPYFPQNRRVSNKAPWASQNHPGYSLVSFGAPDTVNYPPDPGVDADLDILQMEQEADSAVAQFSHQKALKLRAMGDCKSAAGELADLIKKNPNYSRRMEALAQRIDCLFQLGESQFAKRELAWLHQLSPSLSLIVKERWESTIP